MCEYCMRHDAAHEDKSEQRVSLFPDQGEAAVLEKRLGPAPERLVSLRAIREGQKVRIARVQAHGELGRRIRDMGLVSGTEVEVVGRAPLRDPVALRLPGFTLSLRNNEADYIVVEVL